MASMYLCSVLLCALALQVSIRRGEAELDTGIVLPQPDVYHVVAQKNGRFLLNCTVTSKPPLTFTWHKNGRPLVLDGQRRIQVVNGSLLFKRVLNRRKKNITDEGIYECHAKNHYGSIIAKRVKMEIAGIAKSFSQEPQSQIVVAGGVVRLQCQIKSNPPPMYTWLKNEVQIRSSKRHLILPGGILQILELNKNEDEGVYRCTSTPGDLHKLPDQVEQLTWKRSHKANITVKQVSGRRSPTIVKVPNIAAVEKGKSAILECLADGNPKPLISWQREGGQKISDSHSFIEGNLKLLEVKETDSGIYTCSAKSSGFPDASNRVELKVQTKPRVVKKPSNKEYSRTRTARFHCQFSGSPTPKVTWYKNGKQIFTGGRFKISKKNTLIIVNSVLADSGYYQCIGENVLGYASEIARLSIYTPDESPDQPRNVTAFAVSRDAINVYWNHSQSVSAPVLAYTVVLEESNSKVLALPRSELVHGGTHILIEKLKPFTEYTVYVTAYSQNGAGPKSNTIKVRTKESVPSLPPTISLASATPQSIQIKWQELKPEYRNGIITGYIIFFKKDGNYPVEKREVTQKYKSFLITGLTPNSQYKVRVLAGTKVGFPVFDDSIWPWVDYRTAPINTSSEGSSNPMPPSNLNVMALSPTSVNVSWQHKSGDHPASSFTLTVTKLTSENMQQKFQITDPTVTSYKVTNLENDTSYEFSLVANNKYGPSGLVVQEYKTSLNPMPPPPWDLQVVNRTATSIYLNWSTVDEMPSAVFEVRCHPLMFLNDAKYNRKILKRTNKSEVLISDLKPYTYYRLDVRQIIGDSVGQWSNTLINKTLEGVPSKPRELKGRVTDNGIIIWWKPPAQPNGNITTYLIMYQVKASTMVTNKKWEIKVVNGSITTATINQLRSGFYTIQLSACTNAGEGPPTDPVIISDIPTATPIVTPKPISTSEDQKLGIMLGVSIGVVCIIICILIIACRNRCFAPPQSHITQAACLHANGHVSGRGNGHACHVGQMDYQMETCTPMLTSYPGENEHSDSKGCGSGNIIVTPNGSRVNGYVPFKNGMRNGHISNGHMTTFVGYTDSHNPEERRGLIATMLAGSHSSEGEITHGKAPDRDSLLDDIDKSLDDSDEKSKEDSGSMKSADGSSNYLPPSKQVAMTTHGTHLEKFIQNTSNSHSTAAKTGLVEERDPRCSSLKGNNPATSYKNSSQSQGSTLSQNVDCSRKPHVYHSKEIDHQGYGDRCQGNRDRNQIKYLSGHPSHKKPNKPQEFVPRCYYGQQSSSRLHPQVEELSSPHVSQDRADRRQIRTTDI